MATLEELKRGLVAAHKAGDTENAYKLANAIRELQKVTPRSEAELNQEYQAMPWYKQLGTAADDLVRIGASGISFGALDQILGPEQQKLTDEARLRSGWAGTAAEVGGTVSSPITRTVGLIGKGASKLAPGLLARIGIGGAEGASLGAIDAKIKGKDLGDAATTGALIGAAIPAAGKILSGTSAFVQGTKPGALSDAFDAGMSGGTVSKSFRQGQGGKKITDAKEEFARGEKSWNNRNVNPTKVQQELADITKEITTNTGVSKLTPTDMAAYEKMASILNRALTRGSNVENLDAVRRQLDDFAGQGEQQAMIATRLRNVIRDSIQKVEPKYKPTLDRYSKAKTAEAAGRELASVFPKSSLLGHLAQTAVIGSGIAGMPIIGPQVALAAPMFSPKASGLIANMFGAAAGKSKIRPGAAAPIFSYYEDRRSKKRKKPLEITIPRGDL